MTGRPPHIRRAWRLVPRGTLPGLQPVSFRGDVVLDPHQDFYRALRDARITDVQHRLRSARDAGRLHEAADLDRLQASMKAVGEPLGYGVYVEVDEKDLGAPDADVWTGCGHFVARIPREEYPGRFYFSPRGAIVPSGARLLLGMMERCIAEAGDAVITMHTDSIIVAATKKRGSIHLPRRPWGEKEATRKVLQALSFEEVEHIRDRFTPLSGIPGLSLWKREEENEPHPDATKDPQLYILSHGPGRYALFNRADNGRIILRYRTETALGHLIPPTGYTREQAADAIWTALIREALGDRHAVSTLPFAREGVLGHLPITTPELLRTGPQLRRKKMPAGTRPFGFLTIAYPRSDDGLPVYWKGLCRLKRIDEVRGCPAPHLDCPYRATCPLAYPIRPVTYDVPGRDILRRGRWFDWRTRRAITGGLFTIPMDTAFEAGSPLSVRTWAEYVPRMIRGLPWLEHEEKEEGPESAFWTSSTRGKRPATWRTSRPRSASPARRSFSTPTSARETPRPTRF